MTKAAAPLARHSGAIDLPTLEGLAAINLNRLAREPVTIRQAFGGPRGKVGIELVFGMEQAGLDYLPLADWLRTEHDPAGCADLVQQIKALFAVPQAAAIELSTVQRPA
jgi:hypothetical protein